jgi:hypothetical protein
MASPSELARRGAEKGAETALAWTARRALIFVLGPIVAGLSGTNLVTAVAYVLVVQGRTHLRHRSGELSDHALRIESVRNVCWGVGAFLGMTTGAVLGSVIPLLGTIVLSMVLGGIGGLIGAGLGRLIGWTVMGRVAR